MQKILDDLEADELMGQEQICEASDTWDKSDKLEFTVDGFLSHISQVPSGGRLFKLCLVCWFSLGEWQCVGGFSVFHPLQGSEEAAYAAAFNSMSGGEVSPKRCPSLRGPFRRKPPRSVNIDPHVSKHLMISSVFFFFFFFGERKKPDVAGQ